MIWPFTSRRTPPAPLFSVWMHHQARAAGVVQAVLNDVADHAGVVLGGSLQCNGGVVD